MFIRTLQDVENDKLCVDWGAGTSHRLLTEKDGLGFTICHTVVRAGSESFLQYKRHFEACYCIAGEGEVVDTAGHVYPIHPGSLYALDRHDPHILRSKSDVDLVLVSVFNPPLSGMERHNLDLTKPSGY